MKNKFLTSLLLVAVCCLPPFKQALAIEVTMLPSPADGQSSLSRLTTDKLGQVHLSWVTSDEEHSALYFSTLNGEAWQKPALIASGNDWFVNWADFPFLSVNGQGKTAHWLQKSSAGTYNYDVVASFFDPVSDKWRRGKTIHKDGVSAEHGFVSMLPLAEEKTFITWLDGRNTASHSDGHASDNHGSSGMTLRAGVFDIAGNTLQEWELDGLTCDCCQTSSAMSALGPVVVYRDRSKEEIRDIYITRLIDDKWTTPAPVYSDNWKIAGCPVNGPAAASRGNYVAVAWFSAMDEQPKVSLGISSDNGATFKAPVTIAEGNTNGRVSLAFLDSGNIAVSWLAANGPDAQLKLAVFDKMGKQLESITIAKTKSSRRSGFPVISAQGETIYITWTDISEGKSVRVAKVSF